MKVDINDPITQGVLIGVLGTLIAGFIIYLTAQLRKMSWSLFKSFKRKAKVKSGIESYIKTLMQRTLFINHPWMKENQTLNDILVPINFRRNGHTEREELGVFIKKIFETNETPRILITGKPGSGKSIAMRIIAREISSINSEINLTPIILNFADIKSIHTSKELEKQITANLEYYQFGKGKKGNAAEDFVKENLYEGKLILLFDGYDEINKSERAKISKFISFFLGTYRKVPAIISSRTAVYEKELPFDYLNPIKIRLAPFTPFAILKFLSHWDFGDGKSPHELFEMINGKTHLSEIASNPLMLTIIAFLYSLPKYKLPDNRVQFYEQCTRALLEEWDRSQKKERANKFESHQKVAILNRIAFDQINRSSENDELIHENKIFSAIKSGMQKLSLKVNEYAILKDEIVLNSGLLQYTPPYDYRFPHRTFMEYFAANHIIEEKTYQYVLNLYQQDPVKWKEVLLLYLGLVKNKDMSNHIFEYLIKEFKENNSEEKNIIPVVFSALTECALPDAKLANEILLEAEQFLDHKQLHKETIEELGYIAANPRWSFSKKAKIILLDLLKKELSNDSFQYVLFALLYTRDVKIDKIIIENLERINFKEFFMSLGSKNKFVIHKLFSLNLSHKKKSEFIEGLKESGNMKLLGSLLIENKDSEIQELAAFALFQMSKLNGFNEFLETAEIGMLEKSTLKILDTKYSEWGWNHSGLVSVSGKKLALLICYYSAKFIKKTESNGTFLDLSLPDGLFNYLTKCFMLKRGVIYSKSNIVLEHPVYTTEKMMMKRWREKINMRTKWYRFLNRKIFYTELKYILVIVINWLVGILGIVGFSLTILGYTSNKFYTFLFDPFTANWLFFQFIFFSIVYIILKLINSDELLEDLIEYTVPHASIVFDTDLMMKNSHIITFCANLVLAIICLFLPFHHFFYNLFLFLYFIIHIVYQVDIHTFYRPIFLTDNNDDLNQLLHNND